MRLPAPTAGLYTVRIEGHHVGFGPQRFALCVTGGVGGPAGAVALDRFEYGIADTLEIEVVDTDAPGPVVALVSSGTETAQEQVISERKPTDSTAARSCSPRAGTDRRREAGRHLGRPRDGELCGHDSPASRSWRRRASTCRRR